MKTLSALLLTGTLPILGFAQSGTPVAEPPPSSPETKPHPSHAPSITETTNPTGKTSGSGTVKELRFAAVDADSDGLISLSEFTTFFDAGNAPRASGQDAPSPTETLFRSIDRNTDNFLSEAEVTAYQNEADRSASRK